SVGHKTILASDTLIDFQIKFSLSIGGIVTHWFTFIVLSALRHFDNESMLSLAIPILMSILTDLQGTLKGKWRYMIPAIPPIHNHVLIPNYQDFKIQDFRYSNGFECFQAINMGRYEHVFEVVRLEEETGGYDIWGQFVARLAAYFGLLTEERLQGLTVIVRDLPEIDMAELVRLQICEELEDTWAWVAPGPKRQQVVTAGASEVIEDAPIVYEVALAILAPVQAPQPPLTSRISIEIRLSRMMDQAGVRYTSYADFKILYLRRTKRKTNNASTSAP
nr:hypothetical protein [Tanacetum cinerariifolium]